MFNMSAVDPLVNSLIAIPLRFFISGKVLSFFLSPGILVADKCKKIDKIETKVFKFINLF